MRLWHYKLIPVLPRTQLLAQWRELNSIFKNQPNHILINYVYDCEPVVLFDYSIRVIREMMDRGISIKSWSGMESYFRTKAIYIMQDVLHRESFLNFPEHNREYLYICQYNLKEKCLRGQKEFGLEQWNKIQSV